MKKKIWHNALEELPSSGEPCLVSLMSRLGEREFDVAHLGDVGIQDYPWSAESSSSVFGRRYSLTEIDRWAYISDILNIYAEEDNE